MIVSKTLDRLGCAFLALVGVLVALAIFSFTPLQAPKADVLLTVDSTAPADIRFALAMQDDTTTYLATPLLRRLCIPVLSDSAVIKIVAVYASDQWPQPGRFLMFWAPASGHEHLHINVGAQGHVGFEPKACQ